MLNRCLREVLHQIFYYFRSINLCFATNARSVIHDNSKSSCNSSTTFMHVWSSLIISITIYEQVQSNRACNIAILLLWAFCLYFVLLVFEGFLSHVLVDILHFWSMRFRIRQISKSTGKASGPFDNHSAVVMNSPYNYKESRLSFWQHGGRVLFLIYYVEPYLLCPLNNL